MDWDKIWAFNKQVIDPVAPRYFGLLQNDLVEIELTDAKVEMVMKPLHPQVSSLKAKNRIYIFQN